ncbi:helix-turn-helix domain-containing protein, partial [Pseudomonas putida]|uniref:AlbA family DNA-binding domain-containing protein n=1 Tax=Pseudomonas putida TaxID=303 RepID=UPI0010756B02
EICRQQFSESETVDFKRALPGRDEKSKVELAKDVAAMANTGGGDLVFGIMETEDGGQAGGITAITGESSDEAQRRILQTLESRIEPRVQGLTLWTVQVADGYVLVMRIPPSWNGPHCVKTDTQRRFTFRH